MLTRNDFYKITNTTQHSQFQKFLEDIVLDKEKRNKFYRDCLHIDPLCINSDTFRGYFEEYAAERKSNKQDFTPESITDLLAKLTEKNKENESGWTAYDPAAGTGSMILSIWKDERDKHFPWDYYPHNYLYRADEISDVTIPYLIHNFAIRGMNAIVVHGDTLEASANQVYFIQNSKDDPMEFSSINVMPHSEMVAKLLNIKKWTAEPINHIEDDIDDLIWRIPIDKEKDA